MAIGGTSFDLDIGNSIRITSVARTSPIDDTLCPLPHLVPISKMLERMRKGSDAKEEREDGKAQGFPVQDDLTLALPKHILAPIDCWRVILPILPNNVTPRSLKSRKVKIALPYRARRGPIVVVSQEYPTLPRVSQNRMHSQGILVAPRQSQRPIQPMVDHRQMPVPVQVQVQPAPVPHYHPVVNPGAHQYHVLHHVPHQIQLPTPPPTTAYAVPVGSTPVAIVEQTHPQLSVPRSVGPPAKVINTESSMAPERRRVAALLQAAQSADDEEYTPEQLAKLTKRMLNRASVQKCRRKQRERAIRLENERASLTHENEVLKHAKAAVEQSGVLELARRVQRAHSAGGEAAAANVLNNWKSMNS